MSSPCGPDIPLGSSSRSASPNAGPDVAIAVHCGVPEVLYCERLIGLAPEVGHSNVMGVGSVSGIHGLHEVITSSFTSRQVRVVFVVLGAQAIRNLIARRIVPNEEGARGFVDVTALMSHVG